MKSVVSALCGLCLATGAFAGQDFRIPFGESVEVKGCERIDVTFRSRVAKGASLEAYPERRSMMSLIACNPFSLPDGSRFPIVTLTFEDAAGKSVPLPWISQGYVMIWSREWRDYRHSAFVPPTAAKARLEIVRYAKDAVVEIENAKFDRKDPFKEPVRNINPFFDYGLFNTSGYELMGATRWRVTPEGKNWFDLLQGSNYPDPFPVKGGEKLELRFRGDSPTWLHCYICFYPEYKDLGNLHLNRKFFVLDAHNQSHHPERVETFEVPPNATWARVYFNPCGKLEDFRVLAK